jgi:S-sulfo-L-cysteine synthase (3-phospho-L-serine-dependent)
MSDPAPGQLLFVESNTTGTGMIAMGIADRLGVHPVLLTSKPSRYAGLLQQPCDVVECDTNDPVALRAAVAGLLAGQRPAGVTTTSEYYLETVADLAASLGVRGNRRAALTDCRNKARTRQVLTAAGMVQPLFFQLRDPTEATAAVAHVGLPCVVKPVDDSGSTGVLRCSSVAQVAAHAAAVLAVTRNGRGQPTARTVLVEQYLPQAELSAEMFSMDGAATCVGITQKTVTGGPHFVETQHIFPAPLPPEVATEITETARQALKATGIEHGASHIELKLTADGPAVVEINARLAGGMIPELVRLATGIDLLEQQLRCAVGLPVELTPSHGQVGQVGQVGRFCRFAGIRFLLAPRAGTLDGVYGADEARRLPGVVRIEVTTAPGTPVQPAHNFADRLGYIIAAASSPAEVSAALEAAAAAITVQVDGAGGGVPSSTTITA